VLASPVSLSQPKVRLLIPRTSASDKRYKEIAAVDALALLRKLLP